MKHSFKIDNIAYTQLMIGINSLFFAERKGNSSDFRLYFDDLWLSDTAVIDDIHKSKGEWAVDLVFASIHNPLKFIRRFIISHPCPKRAAQKAHFMRRLAAKDQRGTLYVNIEQLDLCKN
ncbi:hypothetical protein VB264_09225 [Arcicella aquatica]|uniref:Uncharacterized protein n=1 Tax=Arcicella aquatica TaxID=217141 RepID=A0ABU5QLM2_9BACT|nr:hypothetical protein [Arcicella aquatica]MEA5257966.1 hypothetical protein [Arcicella aquatica]